MKKINSKWFEKFVGVDFGRYIYVGGALEEDGKTRQYEFYDKEDGSYILCYYKEAYSIMGAMIEAYRNKR